MACPTIFERPSIKRNNKPDYQVNSSNCNGNTGNCQEIKPLCQKITNTFVHN